MLALLVLLRARQPQRPGFQMARESKRVQRKPGSDSLPAPAQKAAARPRKPSPAKHGPLPLSQVRVVRVSGVVRFHHGQPVPGAAVYLFRGSTFIRSVTTEKDGTFRAALPDSMSVRVIVRAPRSFAAATLDAAVVPGENKLLIAFGPMVSLRGTVTDTSGQAVAGARVSITSIAAMIGSSPSIPDRKPVLTVRTGSSGEFMLENVDLQEIDTSYILRCRHPSYDAHYRSVKGGGAGLEDSSPLRIVLEKEAEGMLLRCTVVDPSGAPVAKPKLKVDLKTGRRGSYGVTRAQGTSAGRFHVKVVPSGWAVRKAASGEGRFVLTVRRRGFADTEVTFRFQPGETLEKTIVMTRGGIIAGVVRDGTGKPLSNVTVTCNKPGVVFIKHDTTTDDRGRFRFNQLEPQASYSVTAHVRSIRYASTFLRIKGVRPGRRDLVFQFVHRR